MCSKLVNRIVLGLLMLVPGILKLFVFKPSGVTAMLEGLGFPAAALFAWILIILEIVTGLMILGNWRIDLAAWPPIIILLVATILTTNWSDPQLSNILLHLVAITGYWMLGEDACKKSKNVKHSKH